MSNSQILRDAAALCRDPSMADGLFEWAKRIDACPPARQDAIVAALAHLHVALRPLMPDAVRRMAILGNATPYRLPSTLAEYSARLVLGDTPAEITGLTKAEAHAYFSDRDLGLGNFDAPRWLTIHAGIWRDAAKIFGHGLSTGIDSLRTIAVARWFIAVMRDLPRRDALVRRRSERGRHGEMIEGTFFERLDELADADLRPSVDETFDRATRRMWKASERAMARKRAPLNVAPRWWKPARCATLLLSGADLIAEGRDMHHCAAQYADYVKRGSSVIVSLRVPYYHYGRRTESHPLLRKEPMGTASPYRTDAYSVHRSTVEIDRSTVTVRQHKGPSNTTPHPVCLDALAVLLRRWQASGRSEPSAAVSWGGYTEPDDYIDGDDECPF